MAGEFNSDAVSITALTVLVFVTFTAGSAYLFVFASLKTSCNCDPVNTPFGNFDIFFKNKTTRLY